MHTCANEGMHSFFSVPARQQVIFIIDITKYSLLLEIMILSPVYGLLAEHFIDCMARRPALLIRAGWIEFCCVSVKYLSG